MVVTRTVDGPHITVTGTWPDKARTCANGTILSGYGPNTVASIATGEPNSGRWSGNRISRYRRGAWDCELRIDFSVTSTAQAFTVTESIVAYRDGAQIFERRNTQNVPRDLS